MTISIVSPIYKGERMLDSLVGRNTTVLQQMIADGLISACGIQLIVMGMLGLYIGKIFDQAKGQPSYIIRDILNAHTKGEEQI